MKPKARYRVLLASSAVVLLIIGTEAHRRAFRASLRVLEARVEALEQAPPREGWGESSPQLKPVPATVDGEAVPSKPSLERRPRFLGWGRCAGRVYTDVEFPDGETRRYYCRTNAPRSEVAWFVSSIVQDARVHREPLPEE